MKRIESSEEDYEKNTEAITGILQILNMLTQNISISVDSIKGDIQLSNAESIELSANKFRDFLGQNGIKEIEAMNKEFDIDFHEAVTKIPAPKKDMKGKVVDVIEKGYTLNEKVIRYSKVVIGE